jgi:hypothetical protein
MTTATVPTSNIAVQTKADLTENSHVSAEARQGVHVRNSFRGSAAEVDVLLQLKANLAQLDDLHGRMRFLMSEISYLLKIS